MKRKLLTLVFIVSGLMPAIAQNVSDLKTEKDMDRIELCKKNYTTLFGGEALTGQGNDGYSSEVYFRRSIPHGRAGYKDP